MALPDGTYRLDGTLTVRTFRTGLGAKAGHDLTIAVADWEGTVEVHDQDPAATRVAVAARIESFQILTGTGGVKPLTDSDRSEIKKTIRQKVLDTARHPEVAFASTGATGGPERLQVHGDLTIAGTTRPVTLDVRLDSSAEPARVSGRTEVVQSHWGLKPYTAFLGALRVRDGVEVSFDAALVPA